MAYNRPNKAAEARQRAAEKKARAANRRLLILCEIKSAPAITEPLIRYSRKGRGNTPTWLSHDRPVLERERSKLEYGGIVSKWAVAGLLR